MARRHSDFCSLTLAAASLQRGCSPPSKQRAGNPFFHFSPVPFIPATSPRFPGSLKPFETTGAKPLLRLPLPSRSCHSPSTTTCTGRRSCFTLVCRCKRAKINCPKARNSLPPPLCARARARARPDKERRKNGRGQAAFSRNGATVITAKPSRDRRSPDARLSLRFRNRVAEAARDFKLKVLISERRSAEER